VIKAAETPSRPWLSYAAVIIASVLWGSLYPASKPAVAAVGPLQVVFIRVLLAALTLGALVVLRGDARNVSRQVRGRWPGILGLTLVSFSGSSILAMIALQYLPASVNGLLNNTHPLWLAIGTALFFTPRRPGLLVVGSVVALIGVALIFFPDLSLSSIAGPAALSPLGVALSLLGSGVIACSAVLGRRVMRGGDPILISAVASGVAVPLMAALTLANGGFGPILAAPFPIVLLLLHVGIGCTAINFTLWFYALQRLPAAQAAAFQYLIPPLGVIFSAVFLGEPLTRGLLVGGVLILAGLLATQLATSGGKGPAIREEVRSQRPGVRIGTPSPGAPS
jgi:drug/metabolite transporter (DMT)-like permease